MMVPFITQGIIKHVNIYESSSICNRIHTPAILPHILLQSNMCQHHNRKQHITIPFNTVWGNAW